jgi:hypothetical protein
MESCAIPYTTLHCLHWPRRGKRARGHQYSQPAIAVRCPLQTSAPQSCELFVVTLSHRYPWQTIRVDSATAPRADDGLKGGGGDDSFLLRLC